MTRPLDDAGERGDGPAVDASLNASLVAPGTMARAGAVARPSPTTRLVVALSLVVMLGYGCSSTAPQQPRVTERLQGVASWYGEEFAGRTTANGEIFDPSRLTAAHRSLPFGTLLDVTNHKTGQTVRVRVNDRGPYIGGRIIDLSYAAAKEIGLIEPGIGEVEILLVKMGSGDREPPVPFESTVAQSPSAGVRPVATPSPNTPILPPPTDPPVATAGVPAIEPVVVDRIVVQTERGGVVTRTQVAADGRTLEEVPIDENAVGKAGEIAIPRTPRAVAPSRPQPAAPRARPATPRFIVQVGAFSVEANARALQERLAAIGQTAHIDRNDLYRVRLGPYETREQAAAARSTLEARGLSAIILSE